MTLACDGDALESLPLRLMIVAVVAGMSIAPAAEALKTLANQGFIQRCEAELDGLIRSSQSVLMEGSGSSRVLGLDFASEGSMYVEMVAIGGERGGPYMACVMLLLSNGNSIIRSATAPPVWLASSDLGRLEVRSERFDLSLTWELQDSGPVIICEVVGWTS